MGLSSLSLLLKVTEYISNFFDLARQLLYLSPTGPIYLAIHLNGKEKLLFKDKILDVISSKEVLLRLKK